MFDWSDYLTLAHELAQRNEEACQRSAVSRAYYSVYCGARNWLRRFEPAASIPVTSASHGAVWRAFEARPEFERRQIGQWGYRLMRLRHAVDYDDRVPQLPVVVAQAMAESDRLISLLRGL